MACDGPHQLTKVSLVQQWRSQARLAATRGGATCGRCGAELEYIHIIHIHDRTEQVPGLTGRASQ